MVYCTILHHTSAVRNHASAVRKPTILKSFFQGRQDVVRDVVGTEIGSFGLNQLNIPRMKKPAFPPIFLG
jgi:hypothetical protein